MGLQACCSQKYMDEQKEMLDALRDSNITEQF